MSDEKKIKRPGGQLANRPLHFYWIVDCSGSMYGEKIGIVNNAIQATIPEMAETAENNPNAQLMIKTLKFSTGASWVTPEAVKIEDFAWDDLEADGVTDLGKALELLCEQLTITNMSDRALPPVLVLLSDGQPTDNYKKHLEHLLSLPWGKKSVRIAISIGQDADDEVLEQFTGNRELVLQANNAAMLTKMIHWASTVASVVSSPASRAGGSEISANAPSGLEAVSGTGKSSSVMIDFHLIPEDEDIESDDVW